MNHESTVRGANIVVVHASVSHSWNYCFQTHLHSCSKGGVFLMDGYPARDMSFTTSSKFPSRSSNLDFFTAMGWVYSLSDDITDMFVTPSMLQDEENGMLPPLYLQLYRRLRRNLASTCM